LEANLDKVFWPSICGNRNAMHLVKKYKHSLKELHANGPYRNIHFNWSYMLFTNPSVMERDMEQYHADIDHATSQLLLC
jgi:hypothetical protein